MVLYEEYFDPEQRRTTYRDGSEQVSDWLLLVDMLVRVAFDLQDGLADEAHYYKRGLVVTHDELTALVAPPSQQPAEVDDATRDQLKLAFDHVISRQRACAEIGQFTPLNSISFIFGLNLFELFCFILAVAPEYDRKYERVFAYMQDDLNSKIPTLGLARVLFSLYTPLPDETLYAMGGAGRNLCFAEDKRAGATMPDTRLTVPRRLVLYLFEQESMLPALQPVARNLGEVDPEPMCIHGELLSQVSSLLLSSGELPPDQCQLMHLWGQQGSGRKLLCIHLADAIGRDLLSVDAAKLWLLGDADFTAMLENIAVEAMLAGKMLILDGITIENSMQNRRCKDAVDFFVRHMNLLVLTTTQQLLGVNLDEYGMVSIEVPPPNISERLTVWQTYVQRHRMDDSIDLPAYASKYGLTPGAIKNILQQADITRRLDKRELIAPSDIIAAISEQDIRRFERLTNKVPNFYSWEDIELMPEQRNIMQLACDRLKLRYTVNDQWGFQRKIAYGKGVCVLFYGPPGTGKTMAAQVMAREIGMDLYRVDLSQLSSKYIGETQKNISKIFDEAKRSNVILFFDEADSIFSKRTEVQNSNDKHSNNEVSFLLQKIEEYDGMSILSTNLANSFDNAFMRRVTYVLRFEMPTPEMRYKLWTGILPSEAAVSAQIDFQFFADKFELTGSNIKSILYSAAFIAAGDNGEIGPRHIVRALKYEYAKLGKILYVGDLEHYGVYLT